MSVWELQRQLGFPTYFTKILQCVVIFCIFLCISSMLHNLLLTKVRAHHAWSSCIFWCYFHRFFQRFFSADIKQLCFSLINLTSITPYFTSQKETSVSHWSSLLGVLLTFQMPELRHSSTFFVSVKTCPLLINMHEPIFRFEDIQPIKLPQLPPEKRKFFCDQVDIILCHFLHIKQNHLVEQKCSVFIQMKRGIFVMLSWAAESGRKLLKTLAIQSECFYIK